MQLPVFCKRGRGGNLVCLETAVTPVFRDSSCHPTSENFSECVQFRGMNHPHAAGVAKKARAAQGGRVPAVTSSRSLLSLTKAGHTGEPTEELTAFAARWETIWSKGIPAG